MEGRFSEYLLKDCQTLISLAPFLWMRKLSFTQLSIRAKDTQQGPDFKDPGHVSQSAPLPLVRLSLLRQSDWPHITQPVTQAPTRFLKFVSRDVVCTFLIRCLQSPSRVETNT